MSNNFPSPRPEGEPQSGNQTAPTACHDLATGNGILCNRIKYLFNIATKPNQFQRLVRWVRKHKYERIEDNHRPAVQPRKL